MSRISKDFDELERLIDENAEKDDIKSQLRFIATEVATLEAQYATLEQEHAELQAAHALEHRRGVYYARGDPIPFCPNCYEASAGKRIHLYGPVAMMDPAAQGWDCYACNTAYTAEPNRNFVPHSKTGRYRGG